MAREPLYKNKTNKEDKEMEQKLAGHFTDMQKFPYEVSKPNLIKVYRNFRKKGKSASEAYKDTIIKITDDFRKSGKPYF